MKSFAFLALIVVFAMLNFSCSENPLSYNDTCTIELLDISLQPLSEFNSDSLGKFKILVAPGTYYLRVLSPKLSDVSGPFTVTKNNLTQVKAVYDMKLK